MPVCSLENFSTSLAEGVLLGIDVGEKTFGLAISDANWRIASPLKTLKRSRWKKDQHTLQEVWQAYSVKGLVVGWPLLMNGDESRRCESTRHVVGNMLALKDFPCLFWDERLSTQASTLLLEKQADLSRKKRAQVVDAVAAGWILQGALEALRYHRQCD